MRVLVPISFLACFLTACSDHTAEPDSFRARDRDVLPEASMAHAPQQSAGEFQQVARNPVRDVYFGNLHVHTRWSFDAFANDAASGPDEAYRWAKGEPIPGGVDGTLLKIKVALDWYAVSDHAEYLGALPLMEDPDSPVSEHPLAAAIIGDDPKASFDAYTKIQNGIYLEKRNDPILGDTAIARSVWSEVVKIADEHNDPGTFTTFAGYEWTAAPDYRNMHRIIVFADTDTLPDRPLSAIDTDVPEELWKWMDAQRAAGARLLAVPHNGNASNGWMFPREVSYGGSRLVSAYAEARMRNEPLYELTQIKGTSETHPKLYPNDEFGSFEIWDYTLASTATPPEHKRGGYAREALIRGLGLDASGKGNPFKFGFIGDSDTHNSAAAIEEDNYTGKFGFENDPRHRLEGPPGVGEAGARQVREFSSGGVAGVWAESNTRNDIFAALERKETFATSGPRLKVRFFGGFSMPSAAMATVEQLRKAYEAGVPMGGDLPAAPRAVAPTFLVHAIKEVEGANLDRIQIIKGWVDKTGEQRHAIYDVALSGDREPAADGTVPPVGDTVNADEGSYTNTIGDVQLSAAWTDPDFVPGVPAVYYARVLQIPTPRWSTYDAARTGIALPEGLPVSIQERAWTSPIWYSPPAEPEEVSR